MPMACQLAAIFEVANYVTTCAGDYTFHSFSLCPREYCTLTIAYALGQDLYMILMHTTNRNVYLQAVPLFSGGPLMRLNDKYVSAGCFKCQNINKHLNPSSSTQVVVLSIKDARDLEILYNNVCANAKERTNSKVN